MHLKTHYELCVSVTEKVTVGSIVPSKLSTREVCPVISECGHHPNDLPPRLSICHNILCTRKKFPGSLTFGDFEDILIDHNCPAEELHEASAECSKVAKWLQVCPESVSKAHSLWPFTEWQTFPKALFIRPQHLHLATLRELFANVHALRSIYPALPAGPDQECTRDLKHELHLCSGSSHAN